MTKVWEETWKASAMTGYVSGEGSDTIEVLGTRPVERAKLVAAAPKLVRALLAAEWGGWDDVLGVNRCPVCSFIYNDNGDHSPNCELDNALREAGVR